MTQIQAHNRAESPTTTAGRFRTPAWLLIATLPAYVLFITVSVTRLAPNVEISSAELTPGQIGEMPLAWVALTVSWMLPAVLAAVALTLLARRLDHTSRALRFVPICAAVVLLLTAVNLVANVLAFSVDTPTWGDSILFTTGVVSSLFAGWFGTHPATVIVLWALVRVGIAKRTAMVVGVIFCLYWVFEILTYLPALLRPENLAGDMAGLPPFLLGIFWAVVGGALLRARVPSES